VSILYKEGAAAAAAAADVEHVFPEESSSCKGSTSNSIAAAS
jgi:hypothetical protein